MTITRPSRTKDSLAFARLFDARSPACECQHGDLPEDRCGQQATVRVTVVCQAEGCDCAAGVYLLCKGCLSDWRRSARRGRVRLRVAPL